MCKDIHSAHLHVVNQVPYCVVGHGTKYRRLTRPQEQTLFQQVVQVRHKAPSEVCGEDVAGGDQKLLARDRGYGGYQRSCEEYGKMTSRKETMEKKKG